MPAKSKEQQRLFGMALSYKRGEYPDAPQEVIDLANSMDEKKLREYAKTKHEGLPEKKMANNIFKELLDNVKRASRISAVRGPYGQRHTDSRLMASRMRACGNHAMADAAESGFRFDRGPDDERRRQEQLQRWRDINNRTYIGGLTSETFERLQRNRERREAEGRAHVQRAIEQYDRRQVAALTGQPFNERLEGDIWEERQDAENEKMRQFSEETDAMERRSPNYIPPAPRVIGDNSRRQQQYQDRANAQVSQPAPQASRPAPQTTQTEDNRPLRERVFGSEVGSREPRTSLNLSSSSKPVEQTSGTPSASRSPSTAWRETGNNRAQTPNHRAQTPNHRAQTPNHGTGGSRLRAGSVGRGL